MLLLLVVLLGAQSPVFPVPGGPEGILLVVPESDTTMTSSPTYCLSGSVRSGRTVDVNGKQLKVYPSGAFVSLLNLAVGENRYTLTSTNDSGRTISKFFLILREKPLETSRTDSLLIEDVMMEPPTDTWVHEGDILRVQMKGTPDCRATFMNGKPMRERPPTETGGVRGIYEGAYRVQPGDTLHNQPVVFRLDNDRKESVTAQSAGKVTVTSAGIPLIGMTKGDRPALRFGRGEDRLGGAVFSFINPGIALTIRGKQGDQYHVALTENQEAWIDTESVELQPEGTQPAFSLTGSWNVYGDQKFDYVSISLDERLPYVTSQETGPTRIVIDVFGAVSNSNWITQHLTTSEIRNVSYLQLGASQFRVVIELAHKQIWGYEVGYSGTRLIVKVRRQPERLRLKALTIALDAGHGGSSDGAIGSTGVREKDINLATVLVLKSILEGKGTKVILTRATDVAVSTRERVLRLIHSDADLLISVHSNSIGNTTDPEATRGVSTYYKYPCYRPLSLCILQEVVKTGLEPFGNVGSFNFLLNSPTELPNVLVELAFMSNPNDEMKLLDEQFREKVAKRIVDGIEDFLDACDE